jgi:hypothetical protein
LNEVWNKPLFVAEYPIPPGADYCEPKIEFYNSVPSWAKLKIENGVMSLVLKPRNLNDIGQKTIKLEPEYSYGGVGNLGMGWYVFEVNIVSDCPTDLVISFP